MNEFKIDKCQYCGSRNIGEGYQSGYSAITPKDRPFSGSRLNFIICCDCGSVLRAYVEKPEKFMPRDKD